MDLPDDPFAPTHPPPVRGHPILAWMVILAAVAFIMWPRVEGKNGDSAERERLELGLMELQARYLVGVPAFFPHRPRNFMTSRRISTRAPSGSGCSFAIVAGELRGPEAAYDLLQTLAWQRRRHGVIASPTNERLAQLLDKLYGGYEEGQKSADILPAADRDELSRELGWFGQLALAPRDAEPTDRAAVMGRARQTVFLVFGMMAVFAFLVVVGFVALVLGLVFFGAGTLKARLQIGTPHGGVYAEMFALWLALFLGLSFLLHSLNPPWQWRLLANGLVGLGSLLILAYPVGRGVSWRKVRRDLGLQGPANFAREAGLGVVCYLAALPLLVVGVAATYFLMKLQQQWAMPADDGDLFGAGASNAHPLVGFLVRADIWGILQALFLAAIVAPLIEEMMFRGALYRHLREATSCLGRVPSFLVGGALVSFVFAAIHPQGWTAIPVLMSLATGFTLAREWRGSLVGAMVAHGLNNATVTLLVVLATM